MKIEFFQKEEEMDPIIGTRVIANGDISGKFFSFEEGVIVFKPDKTWKDYDFLIYFPNRHDLHSGFISDKKNADKFKRILKKLHIKSLGDEFFWARKESLRSEEDMIKRARNLELHLDEDPFGEESW